MNAFQSMGLCLAMYKRWQGIERGKICETIGIFFSQDY